jgi:hypothetical protein
VKLLRSLPLLLALMIAGCETLDNGDRSILRQHHVSRAVYDKMLHNEQLELPDIIELSKRGLPDPFIIHYLKSTYSVYQLTSGDVATLTRAGVSRGVVDYMLATPSLYGPRAYPYWYAGEPYGLYPYSNPPPVIIVSPHACHHW